MALSMLSFGMLATLAAATTVRSRGLPFGSPPPTRAATVISLMIFVNTRPRLASAAPFLCLIVCHLEWPDMGASRVADGRHSSTAPHNRRSPRRTAGFYEDDPGNVLLFHAVASAVPSALEGLTSVFGMGTGVTPPLWSPGNLDFQRRPRPYHNQGQKVNLNPTPNENAPR